MITLIITCTLLTAAIASATVFFLRKLTRLRFSDFVTFEIEEAVKSLDALSKSINKSSLAFMAFSASAERLENPALKHWVKEHL